MRVFIADDSEMVCERLANLLAPIEGVTIAGRAHDVPRTIDSIRRLTPDAVILDVQMPGGSGLDVVQEIKRDTPAPIVIVSTNCPYPQYRKKYIEAGADYFFDKSMEFDKVIGVINELQGGEAGQSGADESELVELPIRRKRGHRSRVSDENNTVNL